MKNKRVNSENRQMLAHNLTINMSVCTVLPSSLLGLKLN